MRLLDLLLPDRCAACSRPGETLCPECAAAFVRLVPPLCDRCGAPGPWPVRRCAECAGRRLAFARARSAIVYEDRARKVVSAWKEGGRARLAAVAASVVAAQVATPDVELLVPVPGDPERNRARGRAAPEALARELSRVWGIPSLQVLHRVGPRPRQRGLALRDRRRNVRGSVRAERPAPRTACVIDDVYTSGATADACAAALRKAGARRVEVVTLARAVR